MAQPRRKKKFIDANVQGALARRIIFHWVVFLAVASVAAFILQVLSDPFRPFGEHIRDLWWTHGPFILVLLFLLPVFIVDTIKVSHRFAGPVFALRRAIREIVQGKPARRLNFRRHDFWHELAMDYNAMLFRAGLLESDDDADAEAHKKTLASKK